MANPTAFEIGAPLGSRAVTCTVPGIAILAAETWSVTCEALTNVAGPPTNPGSPGFVHPTFAPEMKLLPFTVSVKPAPPAVVFAGEIEEIAGAELIVGGGF
jgi:hypothetical protein